VNEIEAPDDLSAQLDALGLPPDIAVVDARAAVADWPSVKRALMGAFEASQKAARAGAPIVYVVHGDDLLGRRGSPSAMLANGLLAAARTAAIESARTGSPANVLAVGDSTPADTAALWVRRLAEPGGPSGEVVRLDSGHLGKALP
jgi:hypothetical protein